MPPEPPPLPQTAPAGSAIPDASAVWNALRTVFDPEIGENVVDLGLIYRVKCVPGGVRVAMTMTTPACPAAGSIAADAEDAILRTCPEAREVDVEVVFDPPWTPAFMSEPTRKRFGW